MPKHQLKPFTIYCGDNLKMLNEIPDESVDFIYRDGRRKGYFISFDYSSDAIKEIKRLDKEGEIEIIPITVKDLLRRESFGIFD
jgi:hypothetical protein